MRHRLRQELKRMVGLHDDEDSPQDVMPEAIVEAVESDNPEEPSDDEPDDEQPATA